jgi:hypothetical protein
VAVVEVGGEEVDIAPGSLLAAGVGDEARLYNQVSTAGVVAAGVGDEARLYNQVSTAGVVAAGGSFPAGYAAHAVG